MLEQIPFESTHLFRSFPRKQESRAACSRFLIWVPAFAGTNGCFQNRDAIEISAVNSVRSLSPCGERVGVRGLEAHR
jgi:hypothetical protein